jgi:hypothetical protein
LLAAVLELGLPYTMEQNDILHGFIYGSESLVDLSVAQTFLQGQNTKLQVPGAIPQKLVDVAVQRNQLFGARLDARLADIAATGQLEIRRLVGHTLRLLNLLRAAWTAPANSPPSTLETSRQTNGLGIVLYGEPYAHYTLQQSSNLINWASTSIANLRSADSPIGMTNYTAPAALDAKGFYRAAQPVQ